MTSFFDNLFENTLFVFSVPNQSTPGKSYTYIYKAIWHRKANIFTSCFANNKRNCGKYNIEHNIHDAFMVPCKRNTTIKLTPLFRITSSS